jgi:hypothetical protein
VRTYPKADFPADAVYGPFAEPVLRLVTCGGTFDEDSRTYLSNVVVYASLVPRGDGSTEASVRDSRVTSGPHS